MTVAELIARLRELPADLPVFVDDDGREIEVTFVTEYNRPLDFGGPVKAFVYIY